MAEKPVALVIDDNKAVRKLMTLTLEGKGFQVHDAESMKQGIQLASDHPDARLMVTDWFLGDGKGGDIVNHVRKTLDNQQMHVIGISGLGGDRDDPGDMQEFIQHHNEAHPEAPPMHFVEKPFSPVAIHALIDRMGVMKANAKSARQWQGLNNEMKPYPSKEPKGPRKSTPTVRPNKVTGYPGKRFRE